MFKTAAQISKRSFTSSGARNYFARAQILGRVGADVEEVVSASGTRYAKYSIAVQNNRDYPPHWFQVVAFNPKQVDFMVKYVKKG
jgi:single-stranded DNA-binding protein